MKAPVPRPPPPAYGTKSPKALDTVTRCAAHTPGKVAGRQETVKAEMNGLTPGLTVPRRPAGWVDKAANP